MGRLFVDSIGYRDYPGGHGHLGVLGDAGYGRHFLAEICCAATDPRVRLVSETGAVATPAPAELGRRRNRIFLARFSAIGPP